MGSAFVEQMSAALKASQPNLPDKTFVVMREEVNALISERISGLEPLLIAFYKTPLGRKLIRTMPVVIQESMAAGQQWGASLEPEIHRRVQERFKKEKL